MKKVLVAVVALVSIVAANHVKAQTMKIGSFDEESVLGLMPGIQKVDSLLRQYANDSLAPQRDYQMSEFKRKDSTLKADSAKMSASLTKIMKDEIAQHFYTLQNWQQLQNEAIQGKQDQLLRPFREKVYGALQEIIATEKYSHIFKSEVFFAPIPICDNLAVKVALRLNLTVPKDVLDAVKAAGCGAKVTGPTTPAPKGATPPKRN